MKQINIISTNRPGEMARITALLAGAGINIEDLDAGNEGELGTIRVVVDRYDDALRLLREAGFKAVAEDTLVIRLENKPGALAAIAARFSDATINVQSMHIMRRDADSALVSLVTSDNSRAAELVRDVLVTR
jgi:hypothetical protein